MMNMANMQDKLVKHGWFRTTIRLATPVFYNGASTAVPKGDRVLKIDLGGNDKATYDLITPTKRFSQPTKSRGIVAKTSIQDSLLKLGWFKKTDEAVVHGPQSNGKVDLVPEGTTNLDLWLKNYHEGKLSNTSETKSSVGDDVVEILDWIRRKEETVLPGKRKQGMVDKAAFQKNLLSKGWYSATDSLRVETNTPADVYSKAVDSAYHTNTGIDIGPNDSKKLEDDTKSYGKPEGIGQILNMVSTKKRSSQPAKCRDKRSKKAKLNAKAINNLLQESWTMVNRSRYQVTLVKLPEREPTKACITDTLSKSSGIKIEMHARSVLSEIGDVETNVTDLSNNTTSLRRFLRRSKKMLRKMFTCGRNEK